MNCFSHFSQRNIVAAIVVAARSPLIQVSPHPHCAGYMARIFVLACVFQSTCALLVSRPSRTRTDDASSIVSTRRGSVHFGDTSYTGGQHSCSQNYHLSPGHHNHDYFRCATNGGYTNHAPYGWCVPVSGRCNNVAMAAHQRPNLATAAGSGTFCHFDGGTSSVRIARWWHM